MTQQLAPVRLPASLESALRRGYRYGLIGLATGFVVAAALYGLIALLSVDGEPLDLQGLCTVVCITCVGAEIGLVVGAGGVAVAVRASLGVDDEEEHRIERVVLQHKHDQLSQDEVAQSRRFAGFAPAVLKYQTVRVGSLILAILAVGLGTLAGGWRSGDLMRIVLPSISLTVLAVALIAEIAVQALRFRRARRYATEVVAGQRRG